MSAMSLERASPIGLNHTGGENYVLGLSHQPNLPFLNDQNGEIQIPVTADTMQLWLFACADDFDESGVEYAARVAVDRHPPIQRIYQKDMTVWARGAPWPRAFFVDSLATYTDVAVFADFVRQAQGIPLAAVEDGQVLAPKENRIVVTAQDYKRTSNATSFSLKTPGPGIVVLTEVDIPGDVHVEVNQQLEKVFTVNHAFRGVEIPDAGDYQITFTYRPALWNVALALSGCGLLILVMMVIFFSRNKRLRWTLRMVVLDPRG